MSLLSSGKRLSELMGTQVVSVVVGVGPEREQFTIHKDLLCWVSPFFNNAFNGQSAEASSSTMHLKVEKPSHFKIFVEWLYHGKLDVEPGEESELSNLYTLVDLYIFSDAIHCNGFKNSIMDQIQDVMSRSRKFLSGRGVRKIFNNTPSSANAPIRIFCAALLHYALIEKKFSIALISEIFRSCKEVMNEYLRLQITHHDVGFDGGDPRDRGCWSLYGDDPCAFHVHEPGVEGDETTQCHAS